MKQRIALLRNVAVVASAAYVEAAVGLAVSVIIARTLGPADYGHYAFAIWMCGALIMAGNHALPTSSIKFLAEARGAGRPDIAAALVHRFTRWQLASSTAVMAIFIVVMLVRPLPEWRESLPLMLGIAVVAVWARAGFWMRGAMGKGFELFAPESIALAATALLNLLVIGFLAWRSASVEQFFGAYAAVGLAAYLLVGIQLRRAGVASASAPLPEDLKIRLTRHLSLTAVVMLLTLGTHRAVEMTLLKIYVNSETVGYFAIAAALTKGAVDLLAGGMSAVLLPAMSRRYGSGGSGSLASIFTESTRLYWFIGLAIAGLGLTVAEGLVHLLYGPRYDGAIPALMWHLVIAGLVVVNGSAAAVLTASDRQIDRIRVIGCAFVANVLLGLFLIPRYGLNGAIASYGLTQLIETAFAWWYAGRRTKVRLPIGPMTRLAAAAAIAAGLAYAATRFLDPKFAFITGATVFLTTYLALSVVLRTWRAADFEILASVVTRRGRLGSALSGRVLSLQRFALAD